MRKTVYGLGAIAVLGIVAFAGYLQVMEGRLLRADPDHIADEKRLLHFAESHGAVAYRAHCETCHGHGGVGDAGRGIPRLNDADWLYGAGMVSDIERVAVYGIRSGNPKAWNLARMPAYARAQPSPTEPKLPPLSPGGIRDVVEYLVYLQGKGAADPAAVGRGALVYGNVGGCYDCHSADAKGDSAIGAPNLVDDVTLYGDGSRESLFASIARGRQGVCPAWSKVLSPATLREIAVYVYTLSHASTTPTPTPTTATATAAPAPSAARSAAPNSAPHG